MKKVKGLSKKKIPIYTDNSMVINRKKGGWGEVEEGKGWVSGDGRRLDLGGEHILQYTDDVL